MLRRDFAREALIGDSGGVNGGVHSPVDCGGDSKVGGSQIGGDVGGVARLPASAEAFEMAIAERTL
jgi:hypothetical protein